MKIILDTNFLMMPNQFGIDIFEYLNDCELFTLSACIDELKKLAKGKGKNSKAAKVALELIKEKNVHVIKTKGKADQEIVNQAAAGDYYVGTNDVELITRLKKKNVKIVRLKQKKYLIED